MNKGLVFVSVYPSFNQIFEQLCRENHYPYITVDARLEDAVIELKKRFPEDFPPVIISRGVTAEMIGQAYPNAVVIRADPDDSDLIEALTRAKKYGGRIGCLMHESAARYNMLPVLKNLLELEELKLFTYLNGEDMTAAFVSARKMELDAMVGGGQLGSTLGIRYGIPTEFLPSGQRTIWKALTKAWDVLEYLYREHEQELRFRALINTIKDGILSIRDGRITYMNPAAEKFFNRFARQAADMPVEKLNAALPAFLEGSSLSETIRVNGRPLHMEKIICGEQDIKETMLLIRDVDDLQKTEQKIRNELYTKGLVAKYQLEDIITESPRMKELVAEAKVYAQTDANVLISGESGTGKELFAQGIHNASRRKSSPFVAINCAELPEQLLESELFGYVEGAFTGAKKGGKQGLIELAHKGTLFLDEINSTTPSLQAKLLRVVQERQLRRIGSDTLIPIDIRIIAAINVEMDELIREGRFRKDLYYRLNTLCLEVPPLRERSSDSMVLAEHFCNLYSSAYKKMIPPLPETVREVLSGLTWEGNVRELDNVMHRYCVLFRAQADPEALIRSCVRKEIRTEEKRDVVTLHLGRLEEMEQEIIEECLRRERGSRSLAAQKLGISRSTLWRKLGEVRSE